MIWLMSWRSLRWRQYKLLLFIHSFSSRDDFVITSKSYLRSRFAIFAQQIKFIANLPDLIGLGTAAIVCYSQYNIIVYYNVIYYIICPIPFISLYITTLNDKLFLVRRDQKIASIETSRHINGGNQVNLYHPY